MLLLPKRKPVLIMSIDRIALEQLDGEQREIAELIGIESYKKLVRYFGGGQIYVCKADTLMKISRNAEICGRFNGYNYRELALEYNLSTKTIREITAEKLKIIKNMPLEGQLELE